MRHFYLTTTGELRERWKPCLRCIGVVVLGMVVGGLACIGAIDVVFWITGRTI